MLPVREGSHIFRRIIASFPFNFRSLSFLSMSSAGQGSTVLSRKEDILIPFFFRAAASFSADLFWKVMASFDSHPPWA